MSVGVELFWWPDKGILSTGHKRSFSSQDVVPNFVSMLSHNFFEKQAYGTVLKDLRTGDYDFKVITEFVRFVCRWPEMTWEALIDVTYCQLSVVSIYIIFLRSKYQEHIKKNKFFLLSLDLWVPRVYWVCVLQPQRQVPGTQCFDWKNTLMIKNCLKLIVYLVAASHCIYG